MKDVIAQIVRFQKLGELFGRSKTSSFSVNIEFNQLSHETEIVHICVGGYDVYGWGRHRIVETTFQDLLTTLTSLVDEAETILNNELVDTSDDF